MGTDNDKPVFQTFRIEWEQFPDHVFVSATHEGHLYRATGPDLATAITNLCFKLPRIPKK